MTEMALASLHDSWAERGLGYLIDGLWLPEVAYADDVVLLAMSIVCLADHAVGSLCCSWSDTEPGQNEFHEYSSVRGKNP